MLSLNAVLIPSFEEAFGVCGGNVYMLERYVAEYCMMEGKLPTERFSSVMKEKAKLEHQVPSHASGPYNAM